jgi:hypothetical protein
MKKALLTFSVIIIVACLATVAFVSMNSASVQNVALTKDMAKLQDDYDALQEKYYALMWNYSNLDYNYQSVLLQNPFSVVPNPGDSGTPDTQQMLSRYQALQQLYSDLQDQYNQYQAAYQALKYKLDQRLMLVPLEYLITPNDPAVVSLTYSVTGKTGNTTDPNSYWKDIKALYNWVNENIEYRDDGLYPVLPSDPTDSSIGLQQTDQMAQLPNETLALGAGDCEDIAALLVSMIRAYFSNEFLAECIWITGENAGHVAVVIPFSGEQIVILDPIRDYFSHNTLGDISLNTISSEIYNWMNIWRPSLGNDVHVYRVFSDYMDKYFNGTAEYIDWMYNR